MKFHSKADLVLFKDEIGKSIDEDLQPRDHTLFVKRRSAMLPIFKSFRKSQDSKKIWSRSPIKMMKAVKDWHRSMSGRRIHKKLDRFLITKIWNFKVGDMLGYKDRKVVQEMLDLLKQEQRYYRPINEEVELEILIESIEAVLALPVPKPENKNPLWTQPVKSKNVVCLYTSGLGGSRR
jgi:hypothetical protein